MVRYKQLFNEDYTNVAIEVKEVINKEDIFTKIKRIYNYLFNRHIIVTDYEMWLFSKLAYSNYGVNQKFIEDKYNKKYKIIDFINEQDGLQFYVIISQTSKDLIIAFRGTDEWVDWLTNFQIINGKKRQFETAKFKLEEIFKKYPNYELYFCGHSLGGALAQESFLYFYLFNNFKVKRAVTFNSAGVRNKNNDSYDNLSIYNYVIKNDLVGNQTGYHYGKTFIVKAKVVKRNMNLLKLYTHTLDQFDFGKAGEIINLIDIYTSDEKQVS